MSANKILDKNQVIQKIRRIAFQVYENNFQETEIIFAGIDGGGYLLAQLLQKEFSQIAPIQTNLVKVMVDKFHPIQGEVMLDIEVNQVANKTIILVDDVLNTGRTFAYSLKPFLKVRVQKLQTAVLVDRSHKNFPISADYVGYALATTLQEHIQVVLEETEAMGVYLS